MLSVTRALTGGRLRIARAALVALPTLQLAVVAHVMADGCVEPAAAALAAVLCLAGSWVVTAQETTSRQLVAYLAASQVAVHGVMACADGGATVTTSSLLLHVVAALGTALLLRRADASLWAATRLRALLASWRFVLATRPRLVAPCSPAPVTPAPRTRLYDAGARAVPARRGPPTPLLRAA